MAGVALGLGTLLVCELPIVLAILGLGAFSAPVRLFAPAPWIEAIGLVSVTVGLIVFTVLAAKRLRHRRGQGITTREKIL